MLTQMFILGPRLILSIREHHARLIAYSDATTTMTSVAFQESDYVSTSGNVWNGIFSIWNRMCLCFVILVLGYLSYWNWVYRRRFEIKTGTERRIYHCISYLYQHESSPWCERDCTLWFRTYADNAVLIASHKLYWRRWFISNAVEKRCYCQKRSIFQSSTTPDI
jgi:hypothetical protein